MFVRETIDCLGAVLVILDWKDFSDGSENIFLVNNGSVIIFLPAIVPLGVEAINMVPVLLRTWAVFGGSLSFTVVVGSGAFEGLLLTPILVGMVPYLTYEGLTAPTGLFTTDCLTGCRAFLAPKLLAKLKCDPSFFDSVALGV